MEKKMFLKAHPFIFERAKALRHNPTNAEAILWSYLKQKPSGFRFKRQHPISIYIADFYCHPLKLIIEIDGSVHNIKEVYDRDHERQENLENDGIYFLRFTNEEVEIKLENVISKIEKYINNHPPILVINKESTTQ